MSNELGGGASNSAASTPSVSVDAKPVIGGSGSTITFSGSYSDSVAIESIAVYTGATPIGVASIDPTTQTWSMTVTLGEGQIDSLSVVLIDVQDGSARANFSYSLQLGMTGQFYVTAETDFVDGVIASQTFYRSDDTVYRIDSYNAGVLASEHYYNVIGYPFTSYELDYDPDGHLYSRIYYGYRNQDYVTMEQDYSYSSVTLNYSLDDIKYFNVDGSLYAEDFYHSDGGHSIVYYGITGREYTSYEIDYDATSTHINQKYFGITGKFYSTKEQDYVWAPETGVYVWQSTLFLSGDGTLLEKIVYDANGGHVNTYYDVVGKAYTSYEVDYDPNNNYTSIKYFGFTGQFYTSAQYDYNSTVPALQQTWTDATYFAADGSVAEKENRSFDADGSRAVTFYDITGKPYTSYEADFDANNHYTSVKYAGYTDRSFASVQYDYDTPTASQVNWSDATYFAADGSVLQKDGRVYGADGGHVDTLTDFTGKPYTSYEVDFDADNHYTAYKYAGFSGRFYASAEYDYTWSPGASKGTLVDALLFRNDGSLAEKIVYNSDGSQSSTLFPLAVHH